MKAIEQSESDLLREQIAGLTNLSSVQVRFIMTRMKAASLREVVYECLYNRGKSLSGKGDVDESARYYAEYHIGRVMRELG